MHGVQPVCRLCRQAKLPRTCAADERYAQLLGFVGMSADTNPAMWNPGALWGLRRDAACISIMRVEFRMIPSSKGTDRLLVSESHNGINTHGFPGR
jgi:hypothetical protein